MSVKKCSKCGESKPIKDFPSGGYSRKGKKRIHSWCKDCKNQRQKQYFKENPDKKKEKHRKRTLKTYNLTNEQYKKILKEQRGVCSICGKKEVSIFKGDIRRLAIDHNHETGVVRGLLCANCNTGLGLFGEDIDILLSAISYLKNETYNERKIA